jgi:hypothetical protein
MLKRFSHFFAYLLLVLVPLQGLAAANMLACNSLMQLAPTQVQSMPCHEHMQKDKENLPEQKNTCKSVCAALCASLCAMTALPSNIKPASLLPASQSVVLADQLYASITQPNLQRPPIFVS